MSAPRRLFSWLFTDPSDDRIVVAQWPNLALWVFLGSLATGAFVRLGVAGTIVRTIGWVSLAWWASDEILRGVNPWRRLLGGAVLIWLGVRAGLDWVHRG